MPLSSLSFGVTAQPMATSPEVLSSEKLALQTMSKPKSLVKGEDYNFLHHGGYRYIGFVNDAGEAFEPLIGHKGVALSYRIVGLYTLTDMFLSGFRAYNKAHRETGDHRKALFEGLVKGADTALFQMMASYYVLPWIIGQIRVQSSKLLEQKSFANSAIAKNPFLKKYIPVAIAMGAIPVLVKPVDHLFEKTLDYTFRPLVDKWIRPKVLARLDRRSSQVHIQGSSKSDAHSASDRLTTAEEALAAITSGLAADSAIRHAVSSESPFSYFSPKTLNPKTLNKATEAVVHEVLVPLTHRI